MIDSARKRFNQDIRYSLTDAVSYDNHHDKEISECFKVAVEAIYRQAKKNVSFPDQLKTIIADLHEIRQKSESSYDVARLAMTMFPASYRQIAHCRNTSFQAVHKQLKNLSLRYSWIKTVFDLMSEETAHGFKSKSGTFNAENPAE